MSTLRNDNGTWPRFELGRPSLTAAKFARQGGIEQRQEIQASFYDIETWPKSNLAKALPSLQAIEYKAVLELGNLAPLKGDSETGQVPVFASLTGVAMVGRKRFFSGTKRGEA
jgi:hypothetical protein